MHVKMIGKAQPIVVGCYILSEVPLQLGAKA